MKIKFEIAYESDAHFLFDLRNDEITRKSSLNTDLISWSDHIHWLKLSLSNINRKILICKDNELPIGMVRFDIKSDHVELSWTVNPLYRGKGYGKAIVQQASEMYPIRKLARIKNTNTHSINIALSSGFKQFAADGEILFFEKG